jgi:hypothetical protein
MATAYNLEGCTIEFDDSKCRAKVSGPPLFVMMLFECLQHEFAIDDCDIFTSRVFSVMYPPESASYKQRIHDRFFELLMRYRRRVPKRANDFFNV